MPSIKVKTQFKSLLFWPCTLLSSGHPLQSPQQRKQAGAARRLDGKQGQQTARVCMAEEEQTRAVPMDVQHRRLHEAGVVAQRGGGVLERDPVLSHRHQHELPVVAQLQDSVI